MMGQDLFKGSARTKLDRMAAAMRVLHKALIDSTQRDYERVNGRVANPYALFTLVANDPAFAWLQPMTRLIVEIEDLVGRVLPPPAAPDVAGMRKRIDGLLVAEGDPFSTRYLALVQSSPEVAAEHGRFHGVLNDIAAGR
ncbi:MAG: hypothetical protein HY293_14985 [Planctomycetes bacterium]|nr:hypothetical protein [Planctomycetota bacterium]